MAFRKMTRPKFPPRLWSLMGYPGSGKSSFAAQMKAPMVVVDADHRFSEVLNVVQGDVYELSDNKADNVDTNAIYTNLMKNMPGSGVKTVVVDSLTAIITPLVVQAMMANDSGKQKNLVAAFRTKALAMRQLQDAVTRWGSDVLWIYHLQDARDGKAKEITRATLSQTEEDRLTRSINLQLKIVADPKNPQRRGVEVVWARRGRSGDDIGIIWDESGFWKEMPERIEQAVYEGLSHEEQNKIETKALVFFKSPDEAISYAMEKGAFLSADDAKTAYKNVKDEKKPKTAQQMAEYWREAVELVIKKITDDELGHLGDEGTF